VTIDDFYKYIIAAIMTWQHDLETLGIYHTNECSLTKSGFTKF